MINFILVVLATEASFLVGIIVGGVVAALAAFAVTAIRGIGRFSFTRAFFQGAISGSIASATAFAVAVVWGRSLSLPDQALFWIVVVVPALGELGDLLNTASLLQKGTPDKSVFFPLGRLHGAAWTPFRYNIYTLSLVDLRAHEPSEIPALARHNTTWFMSRAKLGFVTGAAASICSLAVFFHVSAF